MIIITTTSIIITINNLEVRSELVPLLGEVVQGGTEHSHLIMVSMMTISIMMITITIVTIVEVR